MINDFQALVLGLFTITVSVLLLLTMMTAAVKHDCRVPPRQISLTGAIMMEFVCPEALDNQ